MTRRGLLVGVLGAWTVDALCGPQNRAMATNAPGPRPRPTPRGHGGGASADASASGATRSADDVSRHKQGAPTPEVHPRSDWKARPPRRPATIMNRAPDRVVVHHTATPNSPDTSVEHAYRLSRDIQRFHMDGRGWDDTGQQLTISRGGIVMEGRNRSLRAIRAKKLVLGAQALNHNSHTLGIENEGTYGSEDPPDALWSSLVEVCAWLCDRYNLHPAAAIVGHRDLSDTDCPGDRFYSLLPDLRADVTLRLSSPDAALEPDIRVPLSGADAPPPGAGAHPAERPSDQALTLPKDLKGFPGSSRRH
ncbi:peptidoglycan recognition family protein [Spirillospora sp. NPDC049652]